MQAPPFALGKTFYNGTTIDTNDLGGAHLEGVACRWLYDPSTTQAQTRTNNFRQTIVVRNVSGINLLPGRVVRWASTYAGKRVDGMTATTAQAPAGIVDDSLPAAGVPTNDLFHLVVSGPCLIRQALSNFGADLAQDDWIYAITAATSQATTSGRFERFVGTFGDTHTTNGTAGNILFNRIGRAMSTSLTSNTNGQVLVWVDLPYGVR
jgi:hypothetical protein